MGIGWATARLPGWFLERFPAEYHRKRLFDELPEKLMNVTPFEKQVDAPLVSAPERAFLELLSEVGVRQPLQEARDLAESADTLRADVIEKLLKRCTSVKTASPGVGDPIAEGVAASALVNLMRKLVKTWLHLIVGLET